MEHDPTTLVVQRYLDELARGEPSEPVVRALLERSACRLRRLCVLFLARSYPRLMKPPMSLEAEDLLGAVAERLMKALREARPTSVRQYFSLAGQHMRWELNDLARRLDEQPSVIELRDDLALAAASSDTGLSGDGRRMLAAIEGLPEEEREAFDLIRIQGMTTGEAAEVLGTSESTVKRRLRRGLDGLAEALDDLRPRGEAPGGRRRASGP
ncbi:sigma-70 family RNA polymerase sigma factor [Aquisphaera insulae]|uniref:sigma-70 family RNA polymerase sigma factor n=1 Tax=Aquisphaera insulae TaxID=2712864 RepID=UPI0013EC38C4|nr:sigma-70 family RNA polymerase sigma factor [Aquisphaera insulae]